MEQQDERKNAFFTKDIDQGKETATKNIQI
jgi:hypothetical protein